MKFSLIYKVSFTIFIFFMYVQTLFSQNLNLGNIQPSPNTETEQSQTTEKTKDVTQTKKEQTVRKTETTKSVNNTNPVQVNVSIREAVENVLEYNLDLQVQDYILQKSRISKNSAWFGLIPIVSVSSSYRRQNLEPEGSFVNPNPSRSSLNAAMTFSSSLNTVVSEFTNILVSLNQFRANEINFETAVSNIAIQTQKSYFDLLIARDQLALLKDKLDIQNKEFRNSEKAYKNGLRDEFSFLQTKLAQLNAQGAYDRQKKSEADLTRAFALLMGYEVETKIILTEKIPSVSDNDIKQFISSLNLNKNASVTAQEKLLSALEISRVAAYLAYLPTVNFSWSLATNFLENPDTDDISAQDKWSDDVGSFTINLSLDLNRFFPWSRQSVAIRHLNNDINAKKTEIAQLKEQNKSKLISLSDDLLLSTQTLKINKTEVETAQRAYKLARDAYNNGLMEVTDFLSSENNLRDAQIKYIVQQAQTSKIMLDIKVLINDSKGVSE